MDYSLVARKPAWLYNLTKLHYLSQQEVYMFIMHAWKGGKKMVANNTTPPPPWSSKKENTETIWLFHSQQSLPQCSPIVPTAKNEVIDSQKQVWGDGLENEKKRNQSNRQAKNSPWTILRPLYTAPISTSINPNTLSTSHYWWIDTPINQMGQTTNIRSSNGSRRRGLSKWRK